MQLPTQNALMNLCATVCLIGGFVCVKRGNVPAHRAFMLAALAFSTIFLGGYLLHHYRSGSIPFRGTGVLRTVYFAILIPHVILAAAVVPLALVTLTRGLRARFDAHRRIARWTLPIWLYVSVTGVIVYLMLYQL